MSVNPLIITHSSKATFRQCRKLYEFKYEHRLRPAQESRALRFGTVIHEAIEELRNNGLKSAISMIINTDKLDDFDIETAAALIAGYEKQYRDCLFVGKELVAEFGFNLPMIHPDRAVESKMVRCRGKIDAFVKLHDGRLAIRETKTISSTIDDRFFRYLLIDSQISDYIIAARKMGFNVDTVIYDVIRKPTISPLKATPIEKRKYKSDGALYANQREFDEDAEGWGERLVADIESRPEYYFARHEITRLEFEIDQAKRDAWDTATDILEAQRTGRWYRNPSRMNCDHCPFFDLCVGLVPWDGERVPDGFIRVDTPHPELKGNHDGKDADTAASV